MQEKSIFVMTAIDPPYGSPRRRVGAPAVSRANREGRGTGQAGVGDTGLARGRLRRNAAVRIAGRSVMASRIRGERPPSCEGLQRRLAAAENEHERAADKGGRVEILSEPCPHPAPQVWLLPQ